jgi:hypothetical protein
MQKPKSSSNGPIIKAKKVQVKRETSENTQCNNYISKSEKKKIPTGKEKHNFD